MTITTQHPEKPTPGLAGRAKRGDVARPIKCQICGSLTILIHDETRVALPVAEQAPIDPYKNCYVLSEYLSTDYPEPLDLMASWRKP